MARQPVATIRPYQIGDRAAVERLLWIGLSEIEHHAAASDPPENEGFLATEWAEHVAGLDSEPHAWSVAIDEVESVVGCLWLRALHDALGPYRSIREIIVAPEARRSGVGTALLRAAEAETRSSNAVMLLISAFASNPAIRLYRRLGFGDFPRELREDSNPSHIVLWKDLRDRSSGT